MVSHLIQFSLFIFIILFDIIIISAFSISQIV